MQECIFCKISKGELPAKIIYDSQDVMAFLDIKPANPGHVLVIPKQHYQFIFQIPTALNIKIMELIKVISKTQMKVLNAQGINILQNNGSVAGQLIPHAHFHLIPRFEKDKIVFHWDALELKEEQFTEIQKRLISAAKSEVLQESATPEIKKEEEKPAFPKKIIKLKPRHA